jgi:peptide/nickel transport system ATP-binding protein
MSDGLVFEDVQVRYGALTAVDRVSLAVRPGEAVGLVGESGSGKSTLARTAVGLAPLAAGRVLLDGTDVRRLPRRPRPIQLVFQDPYSSLDPRLTVGASIAEALPRRVPDRRAEVARLLELIHLDPERATALPSELSGGQRQRVALARALAARPRVVLADEITAALDVSVQGAVLNLVRDLHRRLGLALLVISHNLAVVRYLADVIAVMYLGRLVEVGPAEVVLTEPHHPYTRELLAAAPRPMAPRRTTRAQSLMAPRREAGARCRDGAALADAVAAAVEDAEPADPHHPPTGCRYHPRCRVGPLVLPGRDVCVTRDPATDAHRRPHRAACHFAGAPEILEATQ